MANSYEKFSSFSKCQIKGEHVLIESSITVDSEHVINKVLSLSANPEISTVENLTAEAVVNGNIFISVIYSLNDGTISSGTFVSTFNSKLLDSKINSNNTILVNPKLEECKVVSVNNNVIKVICAINLDADLYYNQEVAFLYGIDSNACIQTENLDYVEFEGKCSFDWLECMEIEVKEQVRTVLSTYASAYIKNITVNQSFATIEGDIVAKVLYLADEENGSLKNVFSTYSFKQEIENDKFNNDVSQLTNICTVLSKVKTTINEKDNTTIFSIELPLKAESLIFKNNQAQVIGDLYSTKCLINASNSSFSNTLLKSDDSFEKKIEGSVALTDNEPRIDKMISMTYTSCGVINKYIKDELLYIEGVVNANIIYINDEFNSINSADVEIPFVVSNKSDFSEKADIQCFVSIQESDCIVKKGREVFIDTKIFVNSFEFENVSGAVISDIKESEPLPQRDYGLEIYFAKSGETSWDIGKQIKVEQEIIEKQNPNIVFPLEKDENIAIYYQKKR